MKNMTLLLQIGLMAMLALVLMDMSGCTRQPDGTVKPLVELSEAEKAHLHEDADRLIEIVKPLAEEAVRAAVAAEISRLSVVPTPAPASTSP